MKDAAEQQFGAEGGEGGGEVDDEEERYRRGAKATLEENKSC
jgi:hypothetical protein